jgi:hypothetical protein
MYLFIPMYVNVHVRRVPCHHGIARPQVAYRRDGLQIWRVAANILNKESRTADMEWASSFWVGCGANNSSPYKVSLLQKITRSFGPGRISLDKQPKRKKINMILERQDGMVLIGLLGSGLGPVEGSCEHCNESSSSIKCWQVPEWLSNWRLLKDSVPWSRCVFMVLNIHPSMLNKFN